MAVAHSFYQIEWSTSDSVSVSSGSTQTSDIRAIATTAIDGSIQVKADNAGTPAAGDTIDVYILYSNGDPDADPDSADEYDTATQGTYVMTLNTNTDDPAIRTVRISTAMENFKVYAVSNAASNSITVSAQYGEVTA